MRSIKDTFRQATRTETLVIATSTGLFSATYVNQHISLLTPCELSLVERRIFGAVIALPARHCFTKTLVEKLVAAIGRNCFIGRNISLHRPPLCGRKSAALSRGLRLHALHRRVCTSHIATSIGQGETCSSHMTILAFFLLITNALVSFCRLYLHCIRLSFNFKGATSGLIAFKDQHESSSEIDSIFVNV